MTNWLRYRNMHCYWLKTTEGLQNVSDYRTAVFMFLTPPKSELQSEKRNGVINRKNMDEHWKFSTVLSIFQEDISKHDERNTLRLWNFQLYKLFFKHLLCN